MKIDDEKRQSTLSAKLTAGEYAALLEHAWLNRQRVSEFLRGVLREGGYLTMPKASETEVAP